MADKSKAQTFGSECSGSIGGTTMLITGTDLNAKREWYEPSANGMIGTQRPANTGRQVVKNDVSGTVTVQPSYAQANTLLGLCFDESTGTFTPADDPTAIDIDVVLSKGVDVYTYADCWLKSLLLQGSENSPLEWVLDLLGQDETDAGSVSALAIPDRMLFSDFTFSLGSNTYFPTSLAWKFDYALTERFHNSVTRSSVDSDIQICTLDLEFDLNSDTWADLLAKAGTDTAINDVILTATNGTNTITITHDEMTVMNDIRLPDVSGKDAITATLSLQAWLKSGSTDIVSITYA